MDTQHLVYFKALLEGHADIMFSAYMRINETQFKLLLPRAQFLRLKFDPLAEIPIILNEANISFMPNPQAIRAQQYLLHFHASVLDEKGYLKQSHKNKLFGNAYAFYQNGDMSAAKLAFEKHCGIPNQLKSKRAIEKLQDIASCAQIELAYGDTDLGLFLLTIIAGIERQFSPVDDIVIEIKAMLNWHFKTVKSRA